MTPLAAQHRPGAEVDSKAEACRIVSDRARTDDAKARHQAEVVLQDGPAARRELGGIADQVWNPDAKDVFVRRIDLDDDFVFRQWWGFVLPDDGQGRGDEQANGKRRRIPAYTNPHCANPSISNFTPSHLQPQRAWRPTKTKETDFPSIWLATDSGGSGSFAPAV